MVTIAIIGILASTVLFALFSAQETARVSKTKSLISKLNSVVMPKWEAYRTRRVPVMLSPSLTRMQAAQNRLDALHDLMRMELPDQWTDIISPPLTLVPSGASVNVPSVTLAYQNAYVAVNGSLAVNSALNDYQGAECLYLIVTLGVTDNLGGRELFNESNIGDFDHDGFKEFQDAWGMPIRFLRWPCGFVSDMQPAPPAMGAVNYLSDPFDPFQVYPANLPSGPTGVSPSQTNNPTFPLYPLIYSAGSDKTYGLYTTFLDGSGNAQTTVKNWCYPFMISSAGVSVGSTAAGGNCTLTDDAATQPSIANYGWLDNIHNQLIGTR